jgi:hypothetical protein
MFVVAGFFRFLMCGMNVCLETVLGLLYRIFLLVNLCSYFHHASEIARMKLYRPKYAKNKPETSLIYVNAPAGI